MKFSAAVVLAAAAVATAAPGVQPEPKCPAVPPAYKECTEVIKPLCYPSGKPSKNYGDCDEDEKKKWYPHGKPSKDDYEPSKPTKPSHECPKTYSWYDDCSEDDRKICYPSGRPSKNYDDCDEKEKKDYYPHGKPSKDFYPHGPKHGDKHDDDKHGPKHDDCPAPKYKLYDDCDDEYKKPCYPKGRPGKDYDNCDDNEKKDYYPHGKPHHPSHYTTKTVHVYTTYCPEPTTFTYGTKTYSAGKDEYVSVDCEYGCAIDYPVYTEAADAEYPEATATYAPADTYAPAATATYAPAAPTYAVTAGAAKVAGAGLAAVAGLVALVL